MAVVAQLVEPQIVILVAAGSSPVDRPIFPSFTMIEITEKQFDRVLDQAAFRPRFKRELKFKASIEDLKNSGWADLEILPIWNRSLQGGILLLQPVDELFLVPFTMQNGSLKSNDSQSSMICNFCCTWQSGAGVGLLLYYPPNLPEGNSVGTNCCHDLRCSDHVRTKTNEAVRSRVQLPETMTEEARIARLKKRITGFIEREHLVKAVV